MGYIKIIGGGLKGNKIYVLKKNELRPTSSRMRETLFNWLGQRLDGLKCLDLFAGSGILGFESLSRGADYVLMIEKNKLIAELLIKQKEKFKTNKIEIIHNNALYIINNFELNFFDIIFIDPPFKQINILKKIIKILDKILFKHVLVYIEASLFNNFNFLNFEIVHKKKINSIQYILLKNIKIKKYL